MISATQAPQGAKSLKVAGEKPARKRAYNGGARAEQKQQTQSRVLQAALERFAEVGFEAASVRDIAQAAGLSHAVIRLHYGSKEELWRAAVTFLFKRMRSEMPMISRDNVQSPRASLEALLRGYVVYCARRPEHVRIMLHESIRGGERLDWMTKHFVAPAHRNLEVLLDAAQAESVIPSISRLSLIYILSGAAQTLFALAAEARAIHGVDALDPKIVTAHADALVAVILRSD